MFFSICIPTYNRASYISGTLLSLEHQSFSDFEVIVVDDGSTDDTKSVVQQSKISNLRYVWKENGGKHTALNVGVNLAQGRLFIVLDSDDCLQKDTLKRMFELWKGLNEDERICGIMGRCELLGKKIGMDFPQKRFFMSYLDFHYGKNGGKYKDCCECVRTDLLKKIRWPETEFAKFVPEAFVYDRIGLEYDLLCVDEIFEKKFYLDSGITKNSLSHFKFNCVGYLYDVVDKIENVMPLSKFHLKYKIILWWKYWRLCGYDKEKKGPRCRKISLLGYILFILMPLMNYMAGKNDA